MPAWRRYVQARGLAVLDGMLTTHAEIVRDLDGIEVYRAAWVRQGRGYDLVAEAGMIALHRPSMTAFHAKTDDPARAIAGLKGKLRAQAVPQEERDAIRAGRQRQRQERQAAQTARLVERIAGWDLDAIGHVVVTRADSLRAGNCVPGTDQFIDRYFDGQTSATIGEIARAVGRINLATLSGAELTLARQVAAACLVAIRRDRAASRALQLA